MGMVSLVHRNRYPKMQIVKSSNILISKTHSKDLGLPSTHVHYNPFPPLLPFLPQKPVDLTPPTLEVQHLPTYTPALPLPTPPRKVSCQDSFPGQSLQALISWSLGVRRNACSCILALWWVRTMWSFWFYTPTQIFNIYGVCFCQAGPSCLQSRRTVALILRPLLLRCRAVFCFFFACACVQTRSRGFRRPVRCCFRTETARGGRWRHLSKKYMVLDITGKLLAGEVQVMWIAVLYNA